MNYILKFSPDITIKSAFVRKEMSKRVEANLRIALKKVLEKDEFTLERKFDRLLFSTQRAEKDIVEKIQEAFLYTPGVAFFQEFKSFPMGRFEEIFHVVLAHVKEQIDGKTFRVTVKRSGFHAFTSVQLEQFIGGGLVQHTNGTVKLKNFEEEVKIEVKDDEFFLLSKKNNGVGGIPIFSEQRVLSLISGGFDSAVSSFLMMRKGCPTDFLFFNLGGLDHQSAVEEVSGFLSSRFSNGYDPHFISIPFLPIIRELMSDTIASKYRGILLKRAMMRVAEMVSKDMSYKAIITGESLAQVSSQTLQNLTMIQECLEETPLYRPLFSFTKAEIIDFARKMGTEERCAKIPEYCGVISHKPSTRAKKKDIEYEESKFPMEILDQVFASRTVSRISTLEKEKDIPLKTLSSIDDINTFSEKEKKNTYIIDIREEKVVKNSPLHLPENFPQEQVLYIPFFEIDEQFPLLDQSKQYVFTCSKGVMSRSHARVFLRKGFENIFVIEEPSEQCGI